VKNLALATARHVHTLANRLYRPLERLARWVVGFLLAGVVADLAGIASGVAERSLLDRANTDFITRAEADANDLRQLIVGSVQSAIFVLTAVLFIAWFRRAYRNLPALGAYGLRYGSGWTIGGWFVPILSLWRPKQIANDIWRASDPELPPEEGAGWMDGHVPVLFQGWWAAYIAMSAVSSFAFRSGIGAEDLETTKSVNSAFLTADTLSVLTAVLAVFVVRRTTRRQNLRAAGMGVLPDADPRPLWRRKALWAAIAAALAGLVLEGGIAVAALTGGLGATEAENEPPPQAPLHAPVDALFADDFSQTDVWLVHDDPVVRMDYAAGVYQIVVKESHGLWSSLRELPAEVGSMSVELDLALHAGDAKTDFYGLACLASSQGSYLFGISPDGYYTVGYDPGGDDELELRRFLEDYAAGRFSRARATNRIRAECIRASGRTVLRLSVNGKQVTETTDRRAIGDFIGVALFVYSEGGGTDVRFDDLIVQELPRS
jgi:Domain of unknown function (DUF4328)